MQKVFSCVPPIVHWWYELGMSEYAISCACIRARNEWCLNRKCGNNQKFIVANLKLMWLDLIFKYLQNSLRTELQINVFDHKTKNRNKNKFIFRVNKWTSVSYPMRIVSWTRTDIDFTRTTLTCIGQSFQQSTRSTLIQTPLYDTIIMEFLSCDFQSFFYQKIQLFDMKVLRSKQQILLIVANWLFKG